MDNRVDWEMMRRNALDTLGKLQSENQGSVYKYLLEAAAVIADVVCQREQRFSILELMSVSGKSGYKIIFANPLQSEDSPRHGVSEIGRLYEPQKKLALTEAIESGGVIVANDVMNNPLTQYLGSHIEKKQLKHMAVMPFKRGYLLLFDRAVCGEPFSGEENQFLNQAMRVVNYGFRWYPKQTTDGKTSVLKNALSHRTRNQMLVLAGFQKRLEDAIEQGNDERALSYAEIIAQAGKRLSEDLALFKEVKEYLLESKDSGRKTTRKLSEYLAVFSKEDFQLDRTFFENEFILNHSEKLLGQLFERVKSFMLGNRQDHDLGVGLISHGSDSVTLEFRCTGFKSVKSDIDESLFFIRWIVETLGGKTEVLDDYFTVTLPLA